MIKSPQKRNGAVNIQLPIDSDGSYYSSQRKDHIKYLGVLINALNLKYQISYIKSRIARNRGIVSIFRHYLSLQKLKQLHDNIIISFIHMNHMASYDEEVLTKHTFKIKSCCQTNLLRHRLRA